ncbi:Amidohydrolase family [Geosmithia morbida]|uniref:Amidohydrolase family n=1 Tax=Geosmithia morbida TaxID=1094350 RepID=A0A9P5D0R6_9HYPO|nr:Amidohydrolase family [Geosmithia morbida]KAF4119716.1 Amidohydrolase family [Geosmithia morbida]
MASADHIVFQGGSIFQAQVDGDKTGEPSFASCMVVRDGVIQHVGADKDPAVVQATEAGAEVRNLGGRKVLPSFIDGHIHLLLLGQSLTKVPLDGCKTLEDIRTEIRRAARENPTATRIFARGWMHSMTPDGVDASLLDDLDPRPIFVDTKDLHSTWCNSAGLAEVCATMGIDPDGKSPDPSGGTFQRDRDGRPNGVFNESAVFETIWPFLAQVASMEERKDAIRAAIKAFNSVGYTGMIDMAMDDTIWEPLLELRNTEGLSSMRVAAYWLMKPIKEGESIDAVLAQVDRAADLARRHSDPDCRVVGIKVICDGIVDACTASLKEPYSSGTPTPGPIWTEEVLHPLVARAQHHGLQVALHAIGDNTVRMAIDVLERNADPARRPRIEHIELASEADAARLGRLGITASVQPVHSDPAILRAWPRLIGEHRCSRAFAYREFADGGAVLALGTDAPTAPHVPMPNMYVATTRRSYREHGAADEPDPVNPHFALSVCEAITAATHGSAYSCFADAWTGSLRAGLKADFVVCDVELSPDQLVRGLVKETWFEGRRVFAADE